MNSNGMLLTNKHAVLVKLEHDMLGINRTCSLFRQDGEDLLK